MMHRAFVVAAALDGWQYLARITCGGADPAQAEHRVHHGG